MANVTLPSLSQGEQFVLNDGDVATPADRVITLDGSVIVATGASATLEMSGYSIQGTGKIYCDVESSLNIVAETDAGHFGGVRLTNGGKMLWSGLLNCTDGFVMTNYGTLTLNNPHPPLDEHTSNGELNLETYKTAVLKMYPVAEASWILEEGIVNGCGVFHGDLSGPGSFVLVNMQPPGEEDCPPGGGVEIPTPSSSCITISGDWAQTSGVISVTINSVNYGQAVVLNNVFLGGCTLNVTLSGYTPAYTDNFRIIKAPAVSGSINTFNATASNFDNRGIITLGDGTQAYRLSGY